jgi:tungstate transport system substrate-binding protein
MYNDFVIIGPPEDPAGIKGEKVTDALKAVKAEDATFVSRGDDSGTNKKELGLWQAAGEPAPDKEDFYVQTGQGMLPTINIAAQKDGYTLTDRGTFIKYAANHDGNPPLDILVEGDPSLFNQYSVITVNPAKCPDVQPELAEKFTEWITSDTIQQEIRNFRLLGKPLFIPNAK